ncbi:MAG: ATP-binding cassette domain-containing protein [Muricomes sp.]
MCKEIDTASGTVIMEIENASYSYEGEDNWVWKQISCQFYKGKIHAIAGASGCGKSSLLYLLNGMIPHMIEGKIEGSVFFEGKNITDELPRYRCRKIGLVMQSPESQFCTFTVEEELAFGMENLSLPPEEIKRRIAQTLEYVGMEGYEKCDLNNLSGGQKQKVAIASILVMEPEVLLLDEPTANLDPKSRQEIFSLIVRLSREQGRTIILVEHNLEEIIDEIDYLSVMSPKGELLSGKQGQDIFQKNHVPGRNISKTAEEKAETKAERSTVLEISDLKFTYQKSGKNSLTNNQWILDGLDLSVKEQDFLAIVGENGSWKVHPAAIDFSDYPAE